MRGYYIQWFMVGYPILWLILAVLLMLLVGFRVYLHLLYCEFTLF